MNSVAIKKLQNIYKDGTRIFLVSKGTEPFIKSTSKGNVIKVDTKGLVHVKWDNHEPSTLDTRQDLFYKL